MDIGRHSYGSHFGAQTRCSRFTWVKTLQSGCVRDSPGKHCSDASVAAGYLLGGWFSCHCCSVAKREKKKGKNATWRWFLTLWPRNCRNIWPYMYLISGVSGVGLKGLNVQRYFAEITQPVFRRRIRHREPCFTRMSFQRPTGWIA